MKLTQMVLPIIYNNLVQIYVICFREKAERLNMKELKKQEMVEFHKAREVWKARERILIDKENEKLEAIVRMKEKMENEQSEREERKRTCAMEEKERMIEKMKKEFLSQNVSLAVLQNVRLTYATLTLFKLSFLQSKLRKFNSSQTDILQFLFYVM